MDAQKINTLYKILSTKSINTVFQPIVSLKDGSIFAYETLSRITLPQCDLNIEELFHISEHQNKLWELETGYSEKSKLLLSKAYVFMNQKRFIPFTKL